jgi:tetratricopeptide (TPR) repeat protein
MSIGRREPADHVSEPAQAVKPPSDDQTQRREPHARPSGWRRWVFRLVSGVVIPALFLLLAELSLRVFGFGYPTSFAVKTQVDGQAVYVPNVDFSWRFFPKGLARAPLAFTMPADKPPNTYRLFILGGSAAKGTPEPTFGFGRILETQLRDQIPGVRFEVYNCAATAINSHVVLAIARDCAELQPDLFVVYLGNNEVVGPFGPGTVLAPFSPSLSVIRASLWLKSTRLGQLIEGLLAPLSTPTALRRWGGMGMFLANQIPADAPALKDAYQHLRRNLADLCGVAEQNNVPVIVCTVPTNLKDCPPFASLHCTDLTEDQRTRWETLYQEGVAFEEGGDYVQAVARYLAAADVDDRYADLHYRLGKCYWATGDFERAGECFVRARQLDTLRFRADTRINEIIRAVAKDGQPRGIHLADVEKAFEEASPHATPGEELFHEHVHLNFRGNVLLARTVLRHVRQVLPEWVRRKALPDRPLLTETECAHRLAFTDWDRHRIAAKVLDSFIRQPPFTNQLYHAELVEKLERRLAELRVSERPEVLERARAQYQWAIRNNASDVWLRVNYVSFLLATGADFRVVEAQLETCLESLPVHAETLNRLGLALVERGKHGEAEAFFRKALEIAPENGETRSNLAGALALQGKSEEALSEAVRAVELDPGNANTHHSLGVVLTLQRKPDQAIRRFRQALEIDPDLADTHANLGKLLLSRGELEEAIEHFRKTLELRPNHANAHFDLGRAAEMAGRAEQALTHFREAARLEPNWPVPPFHAAQILATHPDPTVRNGPEAVRLAEQACQATGYRDPRLLDALAAAYAEAGRFSDAVRTARNAISIATPERRKLLADLERRVKLYEAGQPYRAVPAVAP